MSDRTRSVPRREALRVLGTGLVALASACTPARLVLGAYPRDFHADDALVDGELRAFALTVVPGAVPLDPDLIRVLGDPFYGFRRFRRFFASDLCRRAESRQATRFSALPPGERTAVVRDGLAAGGVAGRLYAAAVFLVQVALYGGIWDAHSRAPLAGFDGTRQLAPAGELTYPDAAAYLARPATLDGNPA